MNRLFWRVAPVILATALASCGGGGGGGGASGLPIGQSSASKAVAAQGKDAAPELGEATAVQGLSAQQADQEGGFASPRALGTEALELLEMRIAAYRRGFAYLPALGKVASFQNKNPAPGENVAVDLIRPYVIGAGGIKHSLFAGNVAYDAKRDRLYIPIINGGLGLIRNASAARGEVLVSSFIVPTPMDTYASVILDMENDVLWMVSSTDSKMHYVSIAKIKSISTLEKSNSTLYIGGSILLNAENVTVWHAFSSTFTGGFAIDAKRSTIYMENGDVFDLAAIAPTLGVPDYPGSPYYRFPVDTIKAWNTVPGRRFFDNPRFLTSVALDMTRDRLYFIDGFKKQLVIVNGASYATGAVTPIVIDFPGLFAARSALTIDSKNDRLYIGGAVNDAYVINNASAIGAGSVIPASYVFAAQSGAVEKSEVWGIAIPQ